MENITAEMLPILLPSLKEGEAIPLMPEGTSMAPFFLGGRDTLFIAKPSFPLRKGDIALFRRKSGIFIVHRIHHIRQSEGDRLYFMLGDNQTWIEGPIEEAQIIGVVSSYIRKGKKIDCTADKRYSLLWKAWMFMRPVRPVFIKAFLYWKKIKG